MPGNTELLGRLLRDTLFTKVCAGVTFLFVFANLLGITLWTCPFLAVTKLPCPGCGLTRSCVSMLKGDLAAAVRFHPMGPLFLVIGIVAFIGCWLPATPRLRWADKVGAFERKFYTSPLILLLLLLYALTRWMGIF